MREEWAEGVLAPPLFGAIKKKIIWKLENSSVSDLFQGEPLLSFPQLDLIFILAKPALLSFGFGLAENHVHSRGLYHEEFEPGDEVDSCELSLTVFLPLKNSNFCRLSFFSGPGNVCRDERKLPDILFCKYSGYSYSGLGITEYPEYRSTP